MKDAMLGELYKRVFEEKRIAEALDMESGEISDRNRQVAIEKNKMLSELISVRTEQIRNGL